MKSGKSENPRQLGSAFLQKNVDKGMKNGPIELDFSFTLIVFSSTGEHGEQKKIRGVTPKIRARLNPYSLKTEQMNRIVWALFFAHPLQVDASRVEGDDDCPLFPIKEFEEASSFMKNRKTPGTDGLQTWQRFTNWCFSIGKT